MTTSSRTIRELAEIGLTDRTEVGSKAAVLGELARAGFTVPQGFVLTAGHGVPSEANLDAALQAAGRLEGPFAVRSSGIAEDGADRSYAGQFESVLNVTSDDALIAAIRTCIQSASRDRVRGYAGIDDERMAVLVQRMVDAKAAGVAFTSNPVTGAAETVINAVQGLGDRLLAGEVDGDEWVVRSGRAALVSGTGESITAEEAAVVAALAARIAQHFGEPQDVEWAIADGHIVLLQARPVTALPIPVAVDPPPGHWIRETAHGPHPSSPFKSCWRVADGMHNAANEYGFLVDPTPIQIGGWSYGGFLPVGAPPGRAAPPALVQALLARLVPAIRRRIRRCRTAVRTDLPSKNVERWYTQWRTEMIDRITPLRDTDLSKLDDSALARHVTDVIDLLNDGTRIHFLVDFAHMLAVGEFALQCRDLLGWDDAQLVELCVGLSTTSTEPAHRLAELAQFAAARPAVRALLYAPEADLGALDLETADPEFAAEFQAYQHRYGCRALEYDITQPTIIERPELTLSLLRDQLARGYDPRAEQVELAGRRAAAVAAAVGALAESDRDRFDRLLARAQRAYPAREDNEFFTVSVPLGLVRLAVLEVGRRLTASGALQTAHDVFLLTFVEAQAALRDRSDQRPLVTRRRGELAWVLAHPGPSSYGRDPGPPPRLIGFPAEVRQTARAVEWMIDRAILPGGSEEHTTGLTGIPASPGRYTGPVRVILDETEFRKLRAGDVLVCRTTSPVWSLLFPSIGAIITDAGGSLSHPAIIAREYRIPAIVGTGHATEVLRDGQLVIVDGTAGTIEVQG